MVYMAQPSKLGLATSCAQAWPGALGLIHDGLGQVVNTLLSANADPDATQDHDGTGALHAAAVNGNDAIVWQLIQYKCDVELRDVKGKTALETVLINLDGNKGHHDRTIRLLKQASSLGCT